jgi:hypothetical protein
MRIKLFEMFGTDDYYQEISSDDWLYHRNNTLSIISDNLNEKIKKLILSTQKFTESGYRISGPPRLEGSIIVIDNIDIDMRISLDDDEWYFVWFEEKITKSTIRIKYYKCDQFEGLVKFLKDKEII